MEAKGYPTRKVKRVVLPNGKTIEVQCLDQGTPANDQSTAERQDLHICTKCNSFLVYPTAWEEADEHHWHVELRCPNCEHTETSIFSQDVVDCFDVELDRGTRALVEDLRRLCRATMEEDVERFCAALSGNQILPEDF